MKHFKNTLLLKNAKQLQYLLIITLFLGITGCELIPQKNTAIPTYGDYYLWIKMLDNEELLQEIIDTWHPALSAITAALQVKP